MSVNLLVLSKFANNNRIAMSASKAYVYLRALHIVPELTRPLADIGEEGDKLTTNLLNRFILGDEVMRGPEPSLRAEEEEDQERVKLETLRTPLTIG